MKKKVRVKSLPKAQYGFNNLPAPNVLRPDYLATWQKNNPYPSFGSAPTSGAISADVYSGINNTSGNFNVGMPAFNLNTNPSFYADVYQGDPNTAGSFNVGMPEFFQTKKGTPLYFDKPKTSVGEPLFFNKNTTPFNNPFSLSDPNFIYNTKRPATSGEFVKSPGMGPIGADDYYANLAQQNIASPAGTRFDKDFGYAPGTAMPSDLIKKPNQKGNPYIGPMLLAGTDIFSSVARKIQDRSTEEDFRDQFLADNLYNVRPEDYSGNRGDYLTNTPGFGLNFRPDEAIIKGYNKEAQMGGEMKRKVKITSLPQAGYGGTQNAKAVNQLYGNSAYMMNMFNGATKGEPQEEYNQTLGPDPRSISVLEAEKGETLVRKGTNSTIPEFFKIGGKRHSEGGTPLAGDKATPDSFIYSDTKAMKIKDPAILESFGFTAKKGGYTPAKISKKFDLNSKELREGLYSDSDPLRKKTAVMMADNYISNLGKLALVQESQKGFPQGVPQIAVPYMDKVGLDPAQFLPPSPEEGMAMAMYGGIPKAQNGITRMDGMAEFEKLKRNYYAGNPNTGITQRATPNVPVNRTTPYTAQDIEYKDGRWQVKPTANMQAAPYSVSSQNMSPQRFQDYTFNNPEAAIDLVIKSSGIPSYIERVDKGRQEFLNTLNQPFAKQQMDTIPPAPVKQPVITQKAKPAAQIPKPKVNVAKPSTDPVSSEWGDYEYGGNIPQYQTAGETPQEVAKPNPYAKVFIEERTSKTTGKKAYLYYEGDQKYLVDEAGNEIPGTRKVRTADDTKFTQYGSPEIGTAIDERVRKGNKVIYTRIPAGQFANQPRVKNTGIYLPSAEASARTEGTLSSAEWKDFQDRHGDWIEKEYQGGFNKFKQDLESVDNDPDRLKNLETVGNKAAGWFQDKVNEKSIKATGKPYFKPKDPNSKDPYQRDVKFGRVTYSVPNYFDDETPETPNTPNTPDTPRDPLEPGQLNPPPVPKRPPIGFYPQDVLNTAAAVGDLASINRYYPRMAQFTAEPMEPTFYDPNRELAANAEMANIAGANLAQFTGPQAFNTRFSEVQGKGLANAANILGRYNNLNVGVANQFEQANKQLMNEANFRNQLAANDFYDKTVATNQQYDNARRAGRREAVDYVNAALENRFITDQMNSLYPNFFVDPAALKTYYTPAQKLLPGQKGKDLAKYLTEMGIDIKNPTVQAAMVKSIFGDIDVDERGNILAAQSAMSNRRKTKGS